MINKEYEDLLDLSNDVIEGLNKYKDKYDANEVLDIVISKIFHETITIKKEQKIKLLVQQLEKVLKSDEQ